MMGGLGGLLLAVAGDPTSYKLLKWVHVLGVVIYVGGLLALTRLLGHAVRFADARSREDAYRIFKRMHKFADWVGLGLMLVTGVVLLAWNPGQRAYFADPTRYLHLKLTAVVVLIACDVAFSRRLFALRGEGPQPSATFFRIMHGVVGLSLLLALAALFLVRK